MIGTLWGREPAMIVGLAQALLALGVGFGLHVTPEQMGLIMAALAALLAVVTRSQVSPTNSGSPTTVRTLVVPLLIVGGLGLTACAGNPKPDTSQLSSKGLAAYKAVQVVRAINDVTTGAIAANKTGQLSDAATAHVLTINKQALDVVEADPVGYKAKALVTIKNARDALPAGVDALIAAYLQKTIAILNEVQ